jgi:hypothetical protein
MRGSSHHSLMMEAERASETLDCSSILTRLVAREDLLLHLVAAKASSLICFTC